MDALDAIVDRLIPADADGPGALALGTRGAATGRIQGLDDLLDRLRGFESLDPEAQDETLRGLDESGDPTFAAVVALVHELFYADPRSWPPIGYKTRISGRP